MQKAIELAKRITKDLGNDWYQDLEEHNLHSTFGPIFSQPEIEIEDKNRLFCYIVYAYSPESLWLDLKKDRIDNKRKILDSLGANISTELFIKVLSGSHEIISLCTFNFLEELKDWRWPAIFNQLDYSSKMQRYAGEETESERKWDEIGKDGSKETLKEEIDISTILKINKDKGSLLKLSIETRIQANDMIEQIKKDYVATDVATQSDFGFMYTDSSKKKDILSWRQHIQERNARKKVAI